jgi:hypothetical protein
MYRATCSKASATLFLLTTPPPTKSLSSGEVREEYNLAIISHSIIGCD